LHRVPRQRPDARDLAEAAGILRGAERPLLVAGGGVRYSGAARQLLDFATGHGIPVAETAAGRTLMPDPHRLNAGALGTIGSASANALAATADVVLAVGTRLQDFTTSSWSVFAAEAHIISVNAARFDAVKHAGLAVVGDAQVTLAELDTALSGWQAPAAWSERAVTERATWDAHIDTLRAGTSDGSLSYAQVVGVVNEASTADDYVLGSSGGIPGELNGGWRATAVASMDLEYGFSCMGYEIAGPWGASIARAARHPDGIVTALLGDGSYLMLNSELFSAAFAGHRFVAVLCDNGGYAVIHRLQTGQGAAGFNNLLADCAGPGAKPGGVRVDFAAHAASLGCAVIDLPAGADVAQLRAGYARARELAIAQSRPAVLVCRTDPSAWTESGAWWEVGVPRSLPGFDSHQQAKADQLRWSR
ncbi:MAG: thiamine pyrophosphate-dependent enzyme, partial [Jatrophihabitantaceae bacterium]